MRIVEFVEANASELIGPALDWAAGKAAGRSVWLADGVTVDGLPMVCEDYARDMHWSPSTDWDQGGPLIREHQIGLLSPKQSPCGEWHASLIHPDFTDFTHATEPLIAAMRCIVASKLGDTVQVPKELLPKPD